MPPPPRRVELAEMGKFVRMPVAKTAGCISSSAGADDETGLEDLKSNAPVTKFGTNSLYRPNVAAHIFNEKGQFLACLRMDSRGYQCVQGGVEKKDKDILKAALRELEEEVGLTPDSGLVFVAEIEPPTPSELAAFAQRSVSSAQPPPPTATTPADSATGTGDLPDWRFLRYNYPGFNPLRVRKGQEQRQMLFFLPSDNISSVSLIPDREKFGAKVSQEFKSVKWMNAEDFFTQVGSHKEHIFAYLFLKSRPVIQAFLVGSAAAQKAEPTEASKSIEDTHAADDTVSSTDTKKANK